MSNKDFSVLMSLYAKEKPEYLDDCLYSIFKQSLLPTQIVCVLDGPIGSELENVIVRWKKLLPSIDILRLIENVGLANALNIGLTHCNFDLVIRVDTDDICLNNRFETQIKYMLDNKEVAACSSNVYEFDTLTGKVINERRLPQTHEKLVEFSKTRSPLTHPATIFRKSIIQSIGGYDNIYPEDHLLWYKLIMNGHRIANIDAYLLKMRTDDNFLDRRGFNFMKGQFEIFKIMKDDNFISTYMYYYNLFVIGILRLSPKPLKKLFYKLR